jgi:protein-S-isoprenylcysteine O-methyltransferase Ste14
MLSFIFIGGGFWLLSASWRVLYHAQRAHRLATAGPYARIRHPQYVGFVLIMFGFLVQWPTLVTLIMFPILVTMYALLVRREEAESEVVSGDAWRDYAARTPRFIPHFTESTPAHGGAGSV